METNAQAPTVHRQPNSSHCFACGLQNPYGLQLVFYDNGQDEVHCEVSLPERFNGYPGIAHGGIVAAMMDEVMIRTAMIADPNRFMMTGRMEIRYRLPVPTNEPISLYGRLVKERGRIMTAEGELRLPDGRVAVEASITAADLPEAFKVEGRRLDALGWKVYGDGDQGS